MIALYDYSVTPGDERRWHRAMLHFKLDDEGLERLQRVLRVEFNADLKPQLPALPPGPIEAEFIEEDTMKCEACKGTGVCRDCRDDGTNCDLCDASGKCRKCKGSGNKR